MNTLIEDIADAIGASDLDCAQWDKECRLELAAFIAGYLSAHYWKLTK